MGSVSLDLSLVTQYKYQGLSLSEWPANNPYADIDFEEINEATNLANDEIKCLKVCFDLFDVKKQEFLDGDGLGDIMRAMGFRPSEEELADLLHEVDEDGSGEIEFGE